MKTLYLIRHAKSDWANIALADIDRPLNTRGYTDAHKMSLVFKSASIKPEEIISSCAVRALTTALIFARNTDYNSAKIRIEPSLYHSDYDKYLSIIAETNSKVNTLFLFAHNPTITDCANALLRTTMEAIPTCGIVGITNKCATWEEFIDVPGKLVLFDFPKNNI